MSYTISLTPTRVPNFRPCGCESDDPGPSPSPSPPPPDPCSIQYDGTTPVEFDWRELGGQTNTVVFFGPNEYPFLCMRNSHGTRYLFPGNSTIPPFTMDVCDDYTIDGPLFCSIANDVYVNAGSTAVAFDWTRNNVTMVPGTRFTLASNPTIFEAAEDQFGLPYAKVIDPVTVSFVIERCENINIIV